MRLTMRFRLSRSLPGLEMLIVVRPSLLHCLSAGFERTTYDEKCRRKVLPLPCRPLLDSLLVHLALKNTIYEHAWSMNAIWIQFSHLDEMLHFSNRDLRRGRHHRIKIPCRLAINEIAPLVALPCFYQGKISF